MKNITFLLGAGASFNSLPVVNGMEKRMDMFVEYLEFHKGNFFKNIDNLGLLIDEIKIILNNARPHASIDTYAKKIFLRSSPLDNKNLISLKWLISCYFIFEQSNSLHKKEFIEYYWKKNIESDIILHKIDKEEENRKKQIEREIRSLSKKVDNRYDVFLATLLQKSSKNNTLELPREVNIISWNYDYQLELAFMDYSINPNYRQSNESLKIYPTTDSKMAIAPKFIKLNGTAGYLERHSFDIHNPKKNDFIHIRGESDSYETTHRLTDFLIGYSEFMKNPKSTVSPFLNFAWEKNNNKISQSAFEYAKKIMSETEIVVIIGYSFPNFNRIIDKEIFKAGINSFTHIYYQAPDADRLKERLRYVYPKTVESTSITEVDQFFIPL